MPDPPGVSETIPGTAIDAHGATIAALREALAAGTLTARGLTGFYPVSYTHLTLPTIYSV